MKAERGEEKLQGGVLFGACSLETVNTDGGGSDSDEAMLDNGLDAPNPNGQIPNVPGKKEGGTKTDRATDFSTKYGEKNFSTGGEATSLPSTPRGAPGLGPTVVPPAGTSPRCPSPASTEQMPAVCFVRRPERSVEFLFQQGQRLTRRRPPAWLALVRRRPLYLETNKTAPEVEHYPLPGALRPRGGVFIQPRPPCGRTRSLVFRMAQFQRWWLITPTLGTIYRREWTGGGSTWE